MAYPQSHAEKLSRTCPNVMVETFDPKFKVLTVSDAKPPSGLTCMNIMHLAWPARLSARSWVSLLFRKGMWLSLKSRKGDGRLL